LLKIEAINVGSAQQIKAKSGQTGIFKKPTTDQIEISKNGIVGDFIGDLNHHGGVDQAIYIYTRPDLDWWNGELNTTLAPGTFGENILLSEMTSATMCLGDQFCSGGVVLEITSYRMPCATLAARMNDKYFVKKFNAAMRHGAYCRVISGGKLAAGMAVQYLPFEGARVTLHEMAANEPLERASPELKERIRATPAHWKTIRDLT
jgi:MOSC domain-containing protein YiiM